jgi:hypothetical protein
MSAIIFPSIHSVEHEGFYYVETSDGVFGKGCRRCGGTGHYSFNGFDSICYLCTNVFEARLGDVFETREAAEKWCHERAVRRAQADRKREAERLKLVRIMEGHQAHLQAEAPDVYEYLMAFDLDTDKHSFLRNMAEVLRYVGPSRAFTPKMIEASRSAIAAEAAKLAEQAAHPAPSGRVAVTGEVVSAKVVEGDYGTAYKVLVKDDQGFKVWCSLPKAQVEQAIEEYNETHPEPYTWGPACWLLGADGTTETGIKGRRITFTATLEPSRDDKSFAFGSRPTKGSWL